MGEELSGKTVVIFIACGVLTLLLLFIFAKRQIARFTVKSRRGPHIAIGYDAPKSWHREIQTRMDRVVDVQYEPLVLSKTDETMYSDQQTNNLHSHYYRMKAVDSLSLLEKEIRERQPTLKRHARENLRKFLLSLLCGPLQGASSRLVHQFCDTYDHARHDSRDFGAEEYKLFLDLLMQLIQCVRKSTISRASSARSSPRMLPLARGTNPSNKALPNGRQVILLHRPSNKLDLEVGESSNETEL